MALLVRQFSRWFIQKCHRFLDGYLESGVFLNKEDEDLLEDIVKGNKEGITMDETELADFQLQIKKLLDNQDESGLSDLINEKVNGKEQETSCDLYDENVLKHCLNGFYNTFNLDIISQIDSIVNKYIKHPKKLLKKLEMKYEASLYEFCPIEETEIKTNTVSRLSAWETDKHIYTASFVLIMFIGIVMFITVPLHNNQKLANQLDTIFIICLGFGTMQISQSSSTILNAFVLSFGGSYITWILARKCSVQSQEVKPIRRKPRQEWFNY